MVTGGTECEEEVSDDGDGEGVGKDWTRKVRVNGMTKGVRGERTLKKSM